MKKKSIIVLSMVFLSSTLLFGCSNNQNTVNNTTESISSEHGKSLKIVTTFPPLYAHTANLIDENDKLTNLVEPGTSVHFRQPKPSDIVAMEEADIIITNGIGLEEFLEDYLDNLKEKGISIVDTSKGIKLIGDYEDHKCGNCEGQKCENNQDHECGNCEGQKCENNQDHECGNCEGQKCEHHEDEYNENEHNADEHHHEGPDPHVWLDPSNAKIQASNILEALIEKDPSQKDNYENKASSYIEKLDNLNNKIKENLEGKKIDNFIVFHDAYQYFLEAYNLKDKQVGLIQEFHGDNPSQKQIAELIETIKSNGVKTIYIEPQFNPSIIKNIKQETKVESKEIDPIGSQLSKDGYIINIQNLSDAFINE